MARDPIGVDSESLDCVDIAREILEELARVTDDWERERIVAAIVRTARRKARDSVKSEAVEEAREEAREAIAEEMADAARAIVKKATAPAVHAWR